MRNFFHRIGIEIRGFEQRINIATRDTRATRSGSFAFSFCLALASLFFPTAALIGTAKADPPPANTAAIAVEDAVEAEPRALGIMIGEESAPGVRPIHVIIDPGTVGSIALVNVGYLNVTTLSQMFTITATNVPSDLQNVPPFGPIGGIPFQSMDEIVLKGTFVPRQETGMLATNFEGYAHRFQYGTNGTSSLQLGLLFGSSGTNILLLKSLVNWASNVPLENLVHRTIANTDQLHAALLEVIVGAAIAATTAVGIVVVAYAIRLSEREEQRSSCYIIAGNFRELCDNGCTSSACPNCHECCFAQHAGDYLGCSRNPAHSPYNATSSCIVCP